MGCDPVLVRELIDLPVVPYNPARGVVVSTEGGSATVGFEGTGVMITGDAAGLRDLARWCLALANPDVPHGRHVHLEPWTTPLNEGSLPLLLMRVESTGLE